MKKRYSNEVYLNPIWLENLIPTKFQNMTKLRSTFSFSNLSLKYSKKLVLFLNSSLSHYISNLHANDSANRFQVAFLSVEIKNSPTK